MRGACRGVNMYPFTQIDCINIIIIIFFHTSMKRFLHIMRKDTKYYIIFVIISLVVCIHCFYQSKSGFEPRIHRKHLAKKHRLLQFSRTVHKISTSHKKSSDIPFS